MQEEEEELDRQEERSKAEEIRDLGIKADEEIKQEQAQNE
jgi:hypothetical protein